MAPNSSHINRKPTASPPIYVLCYFEHFVFDRELFIEAYLECCIGFSITCEALGDERVCMLVLLGAVTSYKSYLNSYLIIYFHLESCCVV